jgi:sugar phosphate isomerase/epimerase
MIITMHGLSTMHCNIATEIRIAGEVGFDALEIVESKLVRYMDVGMNLEDLPPLFKRHKIRPVTINALKNIERTERKDRRDLMKEADRLCSAARAIGCPTIQLVPLCGLKGRPYREILKLTCKNVVEIADIGESSGVRFQLEPIAWSPIHSLSQSLELIERAGRDNVGMVIDFWHLWAGEATTPDEVATLPAELIYSVHFCDGVRRPKGARWDEPALRGYLPGEGRVPIQDWVAAIKATGFDGVWSSELLSPRHWEWDLYEIARETKTLMERYIR